MATLVMLNVGYRAFLDITEVVTFSSNMSMINQIVDKNDNSFSKFTMAVAVFLKFGHYV